MTTVLVTGASGFVGGHVARRLAETMTVRCLVRNPGGKTVMSLNHPNITLIKGDLTDEASLAAAADGADLVVHAATDTSFKDRKQSWDVSVEGTRRLYQAARAGGARRFVFISTASIYGGTPGNTREDAVPAPFGDLYADEKIAAEQLLTGAPAGGPAVVILRPPAVYGPGSKWSIDAMKGARNGKLFLPAGGQFPFPHIYVENFVEAVVAALTAPSPGGAYNIFDGVTTYAEFVQPYANAAGSQAKQMPYAMLWLVATAAELAGKITGRYAPLNRRTLKAMTRKSGGSYEREKAKRELGWEPRVSSEQGLERTLRWLAENGY